MSPMLPLNSDANCVPFSAGQTSLPSDVDSSLAIRYPSTVNSLLVIRYPLAVNSLSPFRYPFATKFVTRDSSSATDSPPICHPFASEPKTTPTANQPANCSSEWIQSLRASECKVRHGGLLSKFVPFKVHPDRNVSIRLGEFAAIWMTKLINANVCNETLLGTQWVIEWREVIQTLDSKGYAKLSKVTWSYAKLSKATWSYSKCYVKLSKAI